MIKKIILSIIILLVIGIGFTIWFNTQESMEGYVYSTEDSSLWVIELGDEEINKGDSIPDLLKAKASESEGVVFEEPLLNRVTGSSNFQEGDKVKIYWSGGAFQSAPSLVENTFFINKVDN
ncbi:DUF3221 domain-containing protein [Planococcus sp. NCCP-2050]|uniref:DUF3221 domain-containing protein n=1 Tax=Planococcus sp. NCCP-2050 TaxID=2944679 RepID=UPI002041538D|nr:DUF3221 domain-containing protein [Planococcus sp. NCCP-2050]GKW46908.1 hypothetical protein NCCP2050_26000 [Planococcus sp. NCCP-2050]